MARYVARKCVKKSGCETCFSLLFVPRTEGKASECAGFTSFSDKGGLLYPSKQLLAFVSHLESAFTDCFSVNKLHSESISDVLALIRAEERSLGCIPHEAEVKASIVKFYVVTRLHFVKGVNKAKEERRKMLQHLKARRCV
uniref:Uncharacterized protein n=1 Tax=Amblyomma tuberculatum TaxID=48802 RepID=A0A6M2E3C9_9ACAR